MDEISRIVDQLRRAFEGDAWHGPAVKEVLAGVTAEKAAAKPIAAAHTIWQIVLHIATWERIVRRRLEGEVIVEIPDEEDWPPIRDNGEQAWRTALAELERGHLALREAISRTDEARLGEMVPRKDHSVYVMLHSVVQHDVYHAGQIALLKKTQG